MQHRFELGDVGPLLPRVDLVLDLPVEECLDPKHGLQRREPTPGPDAAHSGVR